jgi:hypothetical protein
VDSVYALVEREAWLFCPLLSIFVGESVSVLLSVLLSYFWGVLECVKVVFGLFNNGKLFGVMGVEGGIRRTLFLAVLRCPPSGFSSGFTFVYVHDCSWMVVDVPVIVPVKLFTR